MRARVKHGRRSSGIAGPLASGWVRHLRQIVRHFAAAATSGRSATDARPSSFDNLPRIAATSAAMNHLVLVLALASLASCVTARAPELRVEWSSARRARLDGASDARRWRNEGHARLVWPLAPPPTAPPLPPRSTRTATPLPQALACVDPRLCAWERDARRRAWARHVRTGGRPR